MPSSKQASGTDAIAMLKADHDAVKKLFEEFESIKDDANASEKEALVNQICTELTTHMELEEALFYPASREAIDDEELVNEAEIEHNGAKELIEQLMEMDSDDEMFDAKVKVLSEYIEHHVEEEEKEMFPQVKKSEIDVLALGEEMAQLKETITINPIGKHEPGDQSGSSARH